MMKLEFLKDMGQKRDRKCFKRRSKIRVWWILVIQKTEALISIDVNTGKNTGSYNLEQTVLNTNLEAAREIPR